MAGKSEGQTLRERNKMTPEEIEEEVKAKLKADEEESRKVAEQLEADDKKVKDQLKKEAEEDRKEAEEKEKAAKAEADKANKPAAGGGQGQAQHASQSVHRSK